MNPKVFGWEHIIFIIITVIAITAGAICAKKFAKTAKSQAILIRSLGGILLLWIIINRFSLALQHSEPNWIKLIPDSFCGMSSVVLALATIYGKKNNNAYHFVWLISLVGGVLTVFYPDFIGQHSSMFYLPTISGLVHHAIAVAIVIILFLLNQINLTYKKWHCSLFGFFAYFTVGAFLITACGAKTAYYMVEPMLPGSILTAWVVAPIYMVAYALILLIVELARKHKKKKKNNSN